MSETIDLLELNLGQYGNIGVVLCAVTYQGQVSVAGEVVQIDDGATTQFGRTQIRASRAGDVFTFIRL